MRIGGTTSLEHIAEVEAIEDPVLRNLWITQTYHDLAMVTAPNMAGNATWLSFAVWASRTVGKTIRNEELPAWVREALADFEGVEARFKPPRWMRALGIVKAWREHAPVEMMEEALREMSNWLARGNTLVFAELAPIYSEMAARFPESSPRNDDAFTAFLNDSEIEGTEDERQAVRNAFTLYYQSQYETDANRRAQMVLAGNINAVLHEQKRLQPHITGSMDATIKVIARGFFLTGFGRLVHATLGRLIPPIDRLLTDISGHVTKLWERKITEFLMALETPSGPDLHLSQDVPPLPGKPLFPELLASIDLDLARQALDQWDRTGGTGTGSGADDWRILADRMNYVVNLFRSRQLEPSLLEPPFEEAQVGEMREGRVPAGPL